MYKLCGFDVFLNKICARIDMIGSDCISLIKSGVSFALAIKTLQYKMRLRYNYKFGDQCKNISAR